MKTRILIGAVLAVALARAQSAGVGQIWTAVTGTLQSGATGSGNGSTLAVQGLSAALVTVNCSVACSGGTTITFQTSQDGTNWTAVNGLQAGTSTLSSTVVNQGTTPTVWEVNVAGAQLLRTPISGYSAGTITVTATAVAAPFSAKTVQANQAGTWTVQPGNSANSTAWLVTGTGGTFPATESGTWTVQPGNTANSTAWLVTGTGGTFPATQSGTWTVQPGNTANSTAWLVTGTGGTFPATQSGNWTARMVGNGGATVDQAPGSAVPTNAVQIGGTDGTNTRVEYMDPCKFSAWTYYPINVSSNTQVVAGSSGKNVYVCKMFLPPVAAAANVNLVESATSNNACATSPTGMLGGATAALGAQVAINGGFVLPADGRAWAKTATSGDAMCIFASAQVTGVLAYVQF